MTAKQKYYNQMNKRQDRGMAALDFANAIEALGISPSESKQIQSGQHPKGMDQALIKQAKDIINQFQPGGSIR